MVDNFGSGGANFRGLHNRVLGHLVASHFELLNRGRVERILSIGNTSLRGEIVKLNSIRYPANQLMLVTGLLSFANLVGFVLNYVLVLPEFLDYGLWIGCLCITPAYLHIFINFKTKYKRFE